MVTSDRCLDFLALAKLAERASRLICHGSILYLNPPLTPSSHPFCRRPTRFPTVVVGWRASFEDVHLGS